MVRSQRRWFIAGAFLAVAAGVLVGCSDGSDQGSSDASDTAVSTTERSTTTAAPTEPTVASSTTLTPTTVEEDDRSAAVVMAGGLTEEFIQVIADLPGVEQSAVIQTGQLRLVASEDSTGAPVDVLEDGFVIQVDGRAYESLASAETFAPSLTEALVDLQPDEVVLSESSAAIRRLDQGSTITFEGGTGGTGATNSIDGARFRVAAILPDDVVGATEVVLIGPDAMSAAGAATPRRIALVDYTGTGDELERLLLAANEGEGIRVFGGRGGDDQQDRDRAVLAQLRVKEIFGEFSYRPRPGGAVEIDPAWVEANIVSVDLPLLGTTKCHRVYAELLGEVLQSLVDDGLEDVIDPGAFQGCWNPRFIGGSDRLSRHAWGIAADINFFNPLDGGPGSPVNPELLDRMAAAGVTSGHNWSSPDPGHFEYLDG